MKLAIICALVCCLHVCHHALSEESKPVERLQQALDTISADLREQRIDSVSSLIDNSLMLWSYKGFVSLTNEVLLSWPLVLERMETLASSEADVLLLFLAFQCVSENEFIKSLHQGVTLCEGGKISADTLKYATESPGSRYERLLGRKRHNPEVKRLMIRLRTLYANDGTYLRHLEDLASGRAEDDQAWFEFLEGKPRNLLDRLLSKVVTTLVPKRILIAIIPERSPVMYVRIFLVVALLAISTFIGFRFWKRIKRRPEGGDGRAS